MLASEESTVAQLKDFEEILKSVSKDQKQANQIVEKAQLSDSLEEREKRVNQIID